MTWFKVDDHAAFNAKVLRAKNEAFGAWTRAGAWTSAEGKNGFIPDETALLIAKKKVWDRCVEAGLMTRSDGGWTIVNYLKYNPSADDVANKREARAQAGAKGGKRSVEAKTQAIASANAQAVASDTFQPPSRPVPTRPDLIPPKPPEGQGPKNPEPEPQASAQARPPLADPELLATFRTVLATNGLAHKRVSPGSWRDLSEQWGLWTVGMTCDDRHELLRRSAKRWCETPEAAGSRYPLGLFLSWAADQEGIGRPAERLLERQEAVPGYQLTPEDEAATAASGDDLLKLLEAS